MDRLDRLYAYDDVLAYTREHGGGTFNAETLQPHAPADGYAVALGVGTAATADVNADGIMRMPIIGAFDSVRDAYPDAPFIGTWLSDGVLHIDPVVILPDRASAEALGRALGQKAIWSFGDTDEITLAA